LKYLELEKGSSRQPLKAGETIPMAHTREPVDIEQFFNMFDKPTRVANQQNLDNFGNGLAGRGLGLNNTIATLRPLVNHAIPVLRNLASPQTDLAGLFKGLGRAAGHSAPVAAQNAPLWSDQDTFFAAWPTAAKPPEQATPEPPAPPEQAQISP